MFGIGGAELVLIVVVLLLFVGPDELPKVARTLGKGLTDLRRAANVAQAELQETMQELTREVDAVKRDIAGPGQDLRDVRAKIDAQLREAAGPTPEPEPVVVIAKRKPAAATDLDVVTANTADDPAATNIDAAVTAGDDPWVAAHRPPPALPDQPADTLPAFSKGPVEPPAPQAAVVAPAFRMPTGAPIAGTVSRNAAPFPAAKPAATADPVPAGPAAAQSADAETPGPDVADAEAQIVV